MIVVHDLYKNRAYLCASPDKAKKGDEAGVKLALDRRETIEVGKTIYEYNIALNRFIAANGRQWKKSLRDAWESGIYPGSTPKTDVPALQRLRNNAIPIHGV
ncbi:hypothetical protein E0765_07175 [Sulfuricurvum sp. IAE1]|uniref:hypothetical protein n=1 Tax=Sulfuricurvum sp. IAE1 TaxID=2546102 RepID=UPI0010488758|nr:hypothetical protein [Sulfuricurvum sp. IAE1]TDA63609.1 hypothetical protein E0765_07175 [Sulfuricurvum sp. IAE1]